MLCHRDKGDSLNSILFLSGRTISVLVSSLYTFAVGLYVLKKTGSSLSFAITLSLQILPAVLLGPFAGVLADKLDKKIMVVTTDTFNGIVFVLLFFISRQGLTVSLIYITTPLISISQTLYNISVDSAVPNIVSEKNIIRLNSIGKMVDSAAAIISPGAGGILFAAVDMRFFILSNGISFLLSALIECFINFELYAKPADINKGVNFQRDLREGLQYIGRTAWIKNSLINFSVFNFYMSLFYSIPVPYILNNVFRLSSKNYGIIQCFMPAGMIIGALLVKKVTDKTAYDKLMIITGLLFSACMFLIGILPVFTVNAAPYVIVPYYGFLLLCFGLIVSLVDIPFINNFQTNIPENIRGRTLSISISIVKVITPAGYLLSGVLMGFIPSFILLLCGSLMLLISYILISKFVFNVKKDYDKQ